MKFSNSNAQGTIEYLVILAVIIIISLVVVGLVTSNGSGQVTSISSGSNQIANISREISVSDTVVGSDGNGLITLQNNSGERLSITKINVEGKDLNYTATMPLGDKKTFSLTDLNGYCSCVGEAGSKKECAFTVYFQSEAGLLKSAQYSLGVECVPEAVSKESTISPTVITPSVNFLQSCVSHPALWAKPIPNSFYASKIDESNNLYAIGSLRGPTTLSFGGGVDLSIGDETAFYLAKYNSDGEAQWAKKFVATGYETIYPKSIDVDSDGNIYVAGYFTGNAFPSYLIFSEDINLPRRGSITFFVAKFNSSGDAVWAKGASGVSNVSYAESVAVDSNGNVFLGGKFNQSDLNVSGTILTNRSSETYNYDFFILKYNNFGVLQWAKNPQAGTGLNPDDITSVAVDSSGNVFVAGSFYSTLGFSGDITLTSGGSTDFFVAKYNSSGVAEWAKNSQAGTGTGTDKITSVAVDSSGNVYVTGDFYSDTLGFSDEITLSKLGGDGFNLFISKYNSGGVAEWAKMISNVYSNEKQYVFVDSESNVYVAGEFSDSILNLGDDVNLSNNGDVDGFNLSLFVAKYNSTGDVEWAKSPMVSGNQEYAKSLGVDLSGNVYVGGVYDSSAIVFEGDINMFPSQSMNFITKYSSSSEESCRNVVDINETCTAGYECASNYCNTLNNACTSGLTGVACANDWECKSDFCTSFNECSLGQIGDTCVSVADCTTYYCDTFNDICSDGMGGKGCTDASECASGVCTSNVCEEYSS